MLSRRKDSADISQAVPAFHVRYIGTTETLLPIGKGCTSQALQKLWDNKPSDKNLLKVSVTFSARGIRMVELERKESEYNSARWFRIEDISYCAADKNVNDRLFCWISKDSMSEKLELHAFLCSSRDKARAMASVLSLAFQLAYKEWGSEQQREKRRKDADSSNLLEGHSESSSREFVTPPRGRSMSTPWTLSSKSIDSVTETESQTNTKKQSDGQELKQRWT